LTKEKGLDYNYSDPPSIEARTLKRFSIQDRNQGNSFEKKEPAFCPISSDEFVKSARITPTFSGFGKQVFGWKNVQ
jgi:hypothetical protein